MVASYAKTSPHVSLEGCRSGILRLNLGCFYAKSNRRIWRPGIFFTQPQTHSRCVCHGRRFFRPKCYYQCTWGCRLYLVPVYVYPPGRLDNGRRNVSCCRVYGYHAHLLLQYQVDGTAVEPDKVPA